MAKYKGTFHLTEELINDLENAYLTLRRKGKPGKKKAYKSGIVRAALEDLKAEGTKSRLAKKLLG